MLTGGPPKFNGTRDILMINFLYEQPARRAAERPATKKATTTTADVSTTTPPVTGTQPSGGGQT
jgi:hypothetical protein